MSRERPLFHVVRSIADEPASAGRCHKVDPWLNGTSSTNLPPAI
jgi:hypothetical protein